MLTAEWLRAACKDVIAEQQNVWVAYSGGIDSHVLLDLARQSFANVTAVHVNHGIAADDDKWQQHCVDVCAALNIKLHILSVIPQASDKGPEAALRTARRVAWQQLLQVNDVLLIAHHAADQAETILYRLLRGTGPHGLSGMSRVSKLGRAKLVRPLLDIKKATILAYAKQHNLSWIEDHSNHNNTYARNYIRNQVMPLLQQRWPSALDNINRAGVLCAKLVQHTQPVLKDKLATMLKADQLLDLIKLQQEDLLWQQQLLRAWLQLFALTPSVKQLRLLHEQVVNAKADAMPEFKIGQCYVKRSNNQLYLLHSKTVVHSNWQQPWDLQNDLLLPTGQYLCRQQIAATPEFWRKLSQYNVAVRLGTHGRKAKKIFQQMAIPPWERINYPLIFADDRLVCIVGLWLSPRF